MPGNVKMALPDGRVVDGTEVPIDETTERWSDVKLSDGTILRIKLAVISAVRANGAFDPQGNPMYSLNMTPVMAILSVPPNLRQKGN